MQDVVEVAVVLVEQCLHAVVEEGAQALAVLLEPQAGRHLPDVLLLLGFVRAGQIQVVEPHEVEPEIRLEGRFCGGRALIAAAASATSTAPADCCLAR